MSEAMLEAVGVSKMFGAVRALNEVNLTVGPGVTGLLGPNGSGKSTLIKLFSGQLKPDTGQIHLMGGDPVTEQSVRRQLGLCPEQDRFYEDMTGRAFVEALTRLHGLSPKMAAKQTDWALGRVGMTAFGSKTLKDMSRGMRQRIKMAQAVAHQPKVVLLDEPLTGTDPVGRADLIQLIRDLGAEGHCVIVSSHVLHEVEAMTNDVIFIRFGRLRARGDVFKLRTLIKDRPYRFTIQIDQPRRFAQELLTATCIQSVEISGPAECEVTTTALVECVPLLREAAARLQLTIEGLSAPDADLESVYEYLLGEAQR
jgi:ABC-2 type transport system ATP-binding protein